MARKSLDNILSEDTEVQAEIRPSLPEEEPQTGVTSEPEPQAAPEPEPAEPPSGLPKDVYEPLRAVRDENKALKERLDQLTREIEARARPAEPQTPPPSMWEDEQGWQQHFGGQLVSTAVQQAAYQSRLQMSEMLMSEQAPDFADLKQTLVEFVGKNPVLNQQVAESQHPWRTAYQAFKNQQTMQELGATDLTQLKEKLREELMAEMQAKPPAAMPPSLSQTRSVGARSGPAWSGPKPIKDLLG